MALYDHDQTQEIVAQRIFFKPCVN